MEDNIFAGNSCVHRLAQQIYNSLMTRRWVTYSEELAKFLGKDISYIEVRGISNTEHFEDIKKAFPWVIKILQAVFVDTPGMHKKEVRAINKMMNRAAHSALRDVNLVLFVLDADKWTQNDELVLEKLKNADMPVILVINKIDTLENKNHALPLIQERAKLMNFAEIVPVSALRGANLDHLRDTIAKYLPFQPPLYSLDQLTDRSERFLASEIIREKIMRQLGEELPYDLTVQIESFKTEQATINEKTGRPKAACIYIDATIFVDRPGQKAIVIGEKGAKLKKIGMDARVDMEKMFEQKIMLTLWVKVKGGWSDDERALKSLGYSDI